MDLTPQYAEFTTVMVIASIALGLLSIARLFLKGDNEVALNEDDTPTTLATRGAFVNVVIGRNIVAPIFAWAGLRFTRQEAIPGGGGGGKGFGGGGGGSQTQTVYYEDGWHIICLGPAGVLHQVLSNGKNILPSPISSVNTPSGSIVETEEGRMQIFWGEVNQPVNTALGNRLGNIQSSWPYLCYVFWREKNLGGSANWPSIEYDIEVLCQQNSPGTFAPGLADANGRRGANPASIIHQIWTANWPHGAGLPSDSLDFDSLESFGLLMEAEHLPMNILFREGNNDATKWLQAVLADAGVLLVDYPIGRIVLSALRVPTFPLPLVGKAYQLQPEAEVEVIPFDDINQVDRVLFTYKSIDLKYRDDTVEFGDDGVAEDNSRYRIEKVRLDTVTSPLVARLVANRRAAEILGDVASVKYRLARSASLLMPGQVFEDSEGRIVRVISKKLGVRVPEATIEAMIDTYGLPPLTDTDDDGTVGGAQIAVPDRMVTMIELPASVSGTASMAVGVFRVRFNRAQFGADLWFSIDDGDNYTRTNEQNASCSGFLLNEQILIGDGPDLIEAGPLATSNNPDAEEVLDLSGQESEWQNGRQVCIIEDADGNYEAFFLRQTELQPEDIWQQATVYAINDFVIPSAPNSNGLRYRCSAVSGGAESGTVEPDWPATLGSTISDNELVWVSERFQYRLQGLIRSRYETTPRAFPVGSKVFVIEASKVVQIRNSTFLVPGETLCVKTAPRTSSDTLNIDNTVAYCRQLTGQAIAEPGLRFLITGDGDLIVTNIGTRIVVPD